MRPRAKLDTDLVRQLREKTGAGIMDCKAALIESGGDIEKAVTGLRKKGVEMATKKAARTTREGRVEAYIHHGGKIGVLLEVNCETDFVARNEDFKSFLKDVAMQIAAANPRYISREEVPGKLEKFYQQACLLEQPFIRDEKVFIKDLLASLIGKIGENITIRRFARFQVGTE